MNNGSDNPAYWDAIADEYHQQVWISSDDLHLGPLLPGGRELCLPPAQVTGLSCLEIGCGGAQNSIYLTKQGAACVATDAAERQLARGRYLADEAGVEVDFRRVAMEALPSAELGEFDLVHSVFALGFAENPSHVVREAARFMKPGAAFLLSVLHPLFHHEWLELDDEEWGLFVPDYFSPPEDRQETGAGPTAVARAYPISTVVGWLADASLVVERILEPQAVPASDLPEGRPGARAPYDGMPWRELHAKLRKIPVAAVYIARK